MPISEIEGNKLDTFNYESYTVAVGDTIYTRQHYIVFAGLKEKASNRFYTKMKDDIAIVPDLQIRKLGVDSVWRAEPVFVIRGNETFGVADEAKDLGLHFRFKTVKAEERKIEIEIAESEPRREYIVLQEIGRAHV